MVQASVRGQDRKALGDVTLRPDGHAADVILRPDGHAVDVCEAQASDSQRELLQLLGNLAVDWRWKNRLCCVWRKSEGEGKQEGNRKKNQRGTRTRNLYICWLLCVSDTHWRRANVFSRCGARATGGRCCPSRSSRPR